MTATTKELRENFWGTGVGSLPHRDATLAVAAATRNPETFIPFWPQLPRRTFLANMYVQFSEGLPGVRVDEAGKTIGIDTRSPDYLTAFEKCFEDIQQANVDRFAISRQAAEGLYLFAEELMRSGWQGWVK